MSTISRPRKTSEQTSELMGEARPIGVGLLVVLALLSALAPFATDLYLPAFPVMTIDLDSSATSVQLTLTSFLVGIALGQLIFGPLSDRIGRLRPLVIGAAICIAASVVAAVAPTVGVLIAARFVQGLSGAAGMVIGRAIISDLATGQAAARAFSVMMLVGGVAPVMAPFVGSLLVAPIGWRGILWVVMGLAAVMLLAVAIVVRETHTSARRSLARVDRARIGSPVRALASRTYLGNTFAFGFAFSAMMAYISASPFVYQVMLRLDAVQYGVLFGINALGLVAVTALSAKLTSRFSVRNLLGVGLLVLLATTIVLVVIVVVGAPMWLIPIPIFVAVSSLGLVLGNATALALSAVPRAAGSASAFLGALQFGLAAVVSPLVSIGGEDTALPLALTMTIVSAVALLSFVAARPRRQA